MSSHAARMRLRASGSAAIDPAAALLAHAQPVAFDTTWQKQVTRIIRRTQASGLWSWASGIFCFIGQTMGGATLFCNLKAPTTGYPVLGNGLTSYDTPYAGITFALSYIDTGFLLVGPACGIHQYINGEGEDVAPKYSMGARTYQAELAFNPRNSVNSATYLPGGTFAAKAVGSSSALGLAGLGLIDAGHIRETLAGVSQDIEQTVGTLPSGAGGNVYIGRAGGTSQYENRPVVFAVVTDGNTPTADMLADLADVVGSVLDFYGVRQVPEDDPLLGQGYFPRDALDAVLPNPVIKRPNGAPVSDGQTNVATNTLPGYGGFPVSRVHLRIGPAAIAYTQTLVREDVRGRMNRRLVATNPQLNPNPTDGITLEGKPCVVEYTTLRAAELADMIAIYGAKGGHVADMLALLAGEGFDIGSGLDDPAGCLFSNAGAQAQAASLFTGTRANFINIANDKFILAAYSALDVSNVAIANYHFDAEMHDQRTPDDLLRHCQELDVLCASLGMTFSLAPDALQQSGTCGVDVSTFGQILALPHLLETFIAARYQPPGDDIEADLEREFAILGPDPDVSKVLVVWARGSFAARKATGVALAVRANTWARGKNVGGYHEIAANSRPSGDPDAWVNQVAAAMYGIPLPYVSPTPVPTYERDFPFVGGVAVGGIGIANASGGYGTASQGFILYYPSNTPRFRYDQDLNCLGLIIEEQAVELEHENTNLNSVTSWGNSQLTGITANTDTAPDETVTAEKIVPNAVSGGHFIRKAGNTAIAYVAGTTYVAQGYVKAGDYQFVRVQLPAAAFGTAVSVFFDVVNGTVISSNALHATIDPEVNGFFRLRVIATATTSVSSTSTNWNISNSGTTSNFAGDGVKGQSMWGLSLHAGRIGLSPTINTGTGNFTRNADDCSITSLSAQTDQAFYCAARSALLHPDDQPLYNAGTAANGILLQRKAADSSLHLVVTSGGVTQCDLNAGVIADGADFQCAFRAMTNDCAILLAGGTLQASTSCTVPAISMAPWLGRNAAGTVYWNSTVAYPQTRPTASDADLAAAVASGGFPPP